MSDMDSDAQLIRPGPHQSRILQKHAASGNQIQRRIVLVLAALDDIPGNLSRLDAPHRTHQHGVPDSRLDGLCKRGLVSRSANHLLMAMVAAARHVQDVDASLGKQLGQLDALVDCPARAPVPVGVRVQPIRRADAREQGHVLGNRGPRRFDKLEGQPSAVLEAPAVLIRALVHRRRQEARYEIAVGKVKFDDVEAGADGAAHGREKVALELVNLGQAHGPRRRIVLGKGGVAGPDDVRRPASNLVGGGRAGTEPGRDRRGLSAGVGQLDANEGVLTVRKVDVFLERVHVGVEPDARIFWGDASVWLDRSGLDHHEAGLYRVSALRNDKQDGGDKGLTPR